MIFLDKFKFPFKNELRNQYICSLEVLKSSDSPRLRLRNSFLTPQESKYIERGLFEFLKGNLNLSKKIILYFVVSCFVFEGRLLAEINNFPDYSGYFSLGFESPSYEFEAKSKSTGVMSKLAVNAPGKLVPSISFKDFVTLSYGFKTEIDKNSIPTKGSTRTEDWRLNFSFDKFMVDLFYFQYNGFYVLNSSDIDPILADTGNYLKLSDMYIRKLGVNFTWIYSPERFSLNALMTQTVRQENSGGSWLSGVSFSDAKIESSEGMLPISISPTTREGLTLNEARMSSVMVKGGYGYSWSYKWFLAGYLMLGYGATKSRTLDLLDINFIEDTIFSNRLEVLLSLGYHGDNFVVGIRSRVETEFFEFDTAKYSSSVLDSLLFFGTHF